MGEGGGQVLRSALTLSMITGRSIRITEIRSGRSRPGMRPQHLASAKAARDICGGLLNGAAIGSTSLDFEPGSVRGGRYRFDIGTAGAVTLVLQTVFLPLSLAAEPSEVEITGGTHVPWSPCFDYLQSNWLPALEEAGYRASLKLAQAGYYPRGGGALRARIQPSHAIHPLEITRRGALRQLTVLSAVSRLPLSIAERQRDRALRRLGAAGRVTAQLQEIPGAGPGTFLAIQASYAGGRSCFFGLGRKGKPAERVADEAVNQWEDFQSTDGAIDRYLADQLLLPLALAEGSSRLKTEKVTGHLATLAALIPLFLPVDIQIDAGQDGSALVSITPLPAARP